MSSWISHFRTPPAELVALGMNATELAANPAATRWLVHDLNADPVLPFPDGDFDAVTCCVSVDYLTRPVEVFRDVGRVLRPGGPFVVTFSNRCFPTKAVHGWLATERRGPRRHRDRVLPPCRRVRPGHGRALHAAGHRGRSPVRGVGDQTGGRR